MLARAGSDPEMGLVHLTRGTPVERGALVLASLAFVITCSWLSSVLIGPLTGHPGQAFQINTRLLVGMGGAVVWACSF